MVKQVGITDTRNGLCCKIDKDIAKLAVAGGVFNFASNTQIRRQKTNFAKFEKKYHRLQKNNN